MSRSLVSCAIALTLGVGVGCAGQRTALRSENAELRDEVSELKAQRRRDRRALRDLERRMALEEQQRPRDLPVAVVGPERAAPVAELPATTVPAEVGDPDAEVAYADDDVEIIYVGEAAKDESVRPTIKLHERHERDRYPTAARAPVTRARAGDRIPVTRGKVPSLPLERPIAPVETAGAPDPRALYKRHYQALRDGKHAEAIAGFRAFVVDFAKHDYADNAQYWLGEAYYDQRDFDRALDEFAKVEKLFPNGNKVGDATLKMAFCHQHLGDVPRARALLAEVIERFPKSNAAALAADRLVKLQADN